MKLIEFDNPHSFRDVTLPFLLQAEAERCVELGIIDRLIVGSTSSTGGEPLARPRLWAVEHDGGIEAVAVQTLANRMTVSRGTSAALDMIARRMAEMRWDGRWINGVTPAVGELMGRLSALTGRPSRRAERLRTMQLQRVIDPVPSPGGLRQCNAGDFELLARWCVAFCAECGDPDDQGAKMAGNLLTDGRAFCWENNGPVALACWAGPTPNGIRINFVYTPPEQRRRGFASNLVAALSRRLLEQGRSFCFLFTDQANRTSNHIYESIGYTHVCENERWEFAVVP